jgi:hypothetical protein
MSNTAHITELQAVNRMLVSIGETPVNTLDAGLNEASIALEILRQVSREVQAQGWTVNTWKEYTLSANVDNQFVLGTDVLKVDTVREHSNIDVVMKLSVDGTKYLLWDQENHTETFTQDTLKVTIVYLMDFAELTPSLQHYIMLKAGSVFQKGMVSSPTLFEFTQGDILEALANAEAYDSETEDTNCLVTSTSCYMIAMRNNNGWGM